MNTYIHRDIQEVINSVSKITGINEGILLSKTRKRHIKDARFMAMYFLRENRDYTFELIAEWFNKDHTTIINAVTQFSYLLEKNITFKELYKNLCNDIDMNKFRANAELTHTWETAKQCQKEF
jgi:chromosomal replication initiation ATPase DnaA